MNKDSTANFLVDSNCAGQRIDRFLSDKIPERSRSFIQKLIKQGKVNVNGKIISKNYKLGIGDVVVLKDFHSHKYSTKVKPQKIKLKIVYEDEYILVVSKKAGVVTHPSPGYTEDTLVNAVLYYTDKVSLLGGKERAGIVHRLDKYTSGLIIIARDENMHRLLSDQFKSRKVKKIYEALVWGRFLEKMGEVNLPIGRSRVDRKKMSISIDGGRESVTKFKVKEEFDSCSLVDVNPITGRTHQIRVHFSYIGHPIIGDKKYGNKEANKMALDLGLERQFLHAKKLVFTHPVSNKKVEIEDELAEELQIILEKLRGDKKMRD